MDEEKKTIQLYLYCLLLTVVPRKNNSRTLKVLQNNRVINVCKYLFIKLNAVIMDVFPDKQVASNILAAKIKDSGSNPKRPEESHSDQSKYSDMFWCDQSIHTILTIFDIAKCCTC